MNGGQGTQSQAFGCIERKLQQDTETQSKFNLLGGILFVFPGKRMENSGIVNYSDVFRQISASMRTLGKCNERLLSLTDQVLCKTAHPEVSVLSKSFIYSSLSFPTNYFVPEFSWWI